MRQQHAHPAADQRGPRRRGRARCSGHPYSIDGTVVTGDRAGREIGFPTQTSATDERADPAKRGLRGHLVRLDGVIYPVGRPTWACGPLSEIRAQTVVEAHLIDVDMRPVYGQTLRAAASSSACATSGASTASMQLKAQIAADVAESAHPVRADVALTPMSLSTFHFTASIPAHRDYPGASSADDCARAPRYRWRGQGCGRDCESSGHMAREGRARSDRVPAPEDQVEVRFRGDGRAAGTSEVASGGGYTRKLTRYVHDA